MSEIKEVKAVKVAKVLPAVKTVQIVGNAVVFTSKLKLDAIKKLEKYNRKALSLFEMDGEEKVENFRLASGNAHNVSKYGITFGEANADGFATATIVVPTGIADKKQYVLDTYGETISNLKDLEVAIEQELLDVEAKHNEILNDIEVK